MSSSQGTPRGQTQEARPQVEGLSPTFYTVRETAALLRLDESTVYRHLRAGHFPGVRIGGRYIVPRAVLDRMTAEVLSTGTCLDLAAWALRWRAEQAAAHGAAHAAGGAA